MNWPGGPRALLWAEYLERARTMRRATRRAYAPRHRRRIDVVKVAAWACALVFCSATWAAWGYAIVWLVRYVLTR